VPATGPAAAWMADLSRFISGDGISQTLALYGVDGAGNRSLQAIEHAYILDTVAPSITVTQSMSGTPLLGGIVHDGSGVASVYVRVGAVGDTAHWERAVVDGSSWRFRPDLAGGRYVLTVEAHDRAGNMSSAGSFEVHVSGATRLYLPFISRTGATLRGAGALTGDTALGGPDPFVVQARSSRHNGRRTRRRKVPT
jgi:hypothetical protein